MRNILEILICLNLELFPAIFPQITSPFKFFKCLIKSFHLAKWGNGWKVWRNIVSFDGFYSQEIIQKY